MKISQLLAIPLLTAIAFPLAAQADTSRAFCKYFPNGASEPKVSMPCKFSMLGGIIDIVWQDGVKDSFIPTRDDRPFTYTDDRGGIVYQQRGEDANGKSIRIIKMENGSIHIWGS
jgi:hypothetical protein